MAKNFESCTLFLHQFIILTLKELEDCLKYLWISQNISKSGNVGEEGVKMVGKTDEVIYGWPLRHHPVGLHTISYAVNYWSKGQVSAYFLRHEGRVSVQGVKSLGGYFACLCQRFEFYEVKKKCYYFSKWKWKYFYTFYHFYSEKSSKRAK